MIRECFRTNTGIIFDSHMLKHEVGLDIENILQPPPRLNPDDTHIGKPEKPLSKSFLKTIWAFISTPFVWIWSKLRGLRGHTHPTVVFVSEESRFVSEGEAREELQDAMSPIYDQIPLHWYWRVMEWLPFIIKKQGAEIDGSDSFWAYKVAWNKGDGRRVFHPVMRRGMKVHRSVKTRLESLDKHGQRGTYVPKVRPFIKGEKKKGGSRMLTIEEWLAENPKHFEWVD